MLAKVRNVWDVYFRSIMVVQHGVKLEKLEDSPIHSEPYRAFPNVRDFEKQKIERMFAKDVIQLSQTQMSVKHCVWVREGMQTLLLP